VEGHKVIFRPLIMTCLAWGVLLPVAVAGSDETVDAKARRFIEMLASANKTLPEDDGSPESGVQWPQEYDLAAQKVVYDAADELLKMRVDAVPELLRHSDDKRYSVTILTGSGATRNKTVGDQCDWIVRLLINAGVEPLWEGLGDGTSHPGGDIRKWWKENGNRPLWELQREAVEIALRSAREAIDTPRDFRPDMRKFVRGLEANLAKLNEKHEPLPIQYPRRRMLLKRGDY
jgi:hypothetical protein